MLVIVGRDYFYRFKRREMDIVLLSQAFQPSQVCHYLFVVRQSGEASPSETTKSTFEMTAGVRLNGSKSRGGEV